MKYELRYLISIFLQKRKFIVLILTGLILRVLLALLPGFQIDVNDWFAWSNRLMEVGIPNFYDPKIFSDYTPGYLYVLFVLGIIKNIFLLNNNAFFILLKMPAILSDLLLSYFIYKELSRSNKKIYLYVGTFIILFNPATIFNSSIWGQIDSVPTLFSLLSILYLKNKNLILSSILFGVAFLIKPQSIILIPVFIIFLYKNLSRKNLLRLIFPCFLTIVFLSIPFFPETPVSGIWTLIQKSGNQYPYNSLFAYNFWGILGYWVPDNNIWQHITYQYWGFIIYTFFWLICGYIYARKKIFSIFSLSALAGLSFFFLLTRMHERYLYPSLIFLILVSVLKKSPFLIGLTVILSFVHFINLYYVYIYYNHFYLKTPQVIYNQSIYNFAENNTIILSVFSTLIFFLISLCIIKSDYEYKQS